jgi:MYXO-CTERM domain-containing protein
MDSSVNNFQARYAIRHEWTGAIDCENPRRGVWGGPPNKSKPDAIAARDTAFAPRGKTKLSGFITRDLADLNIKATVLETAAGGGATGDEPKPADTDKTESDPKDTKSDKKSKGGCGCSAPGGGSVPTGLVIVFVALFAVTRRTHA